MPFCKNCGAEVDGRYCAKCGAAVESAPEPISPPVEPAAPGMPENTAAALCYIPGFIVPIIFLVLDPYRRNKLIRFHAFQSIFLNAAMLILWYAFTSFLPIAIYRLIGLLDLAFVVLWIYMLVQTYQGRKILLPVIGDLAAKQA